MNAVASRNVELISHSDQGGRGDGVVQCVSCGVGVESGDADEGVEYAGRMASGAVQLQG